MSRCRFLSVLLLVHVSVSTVLLPAQAQERDWDAVEIRVQPLRGGVYMLSASGGNLAAFVGGDGILVVDADYAEMSGRILATIDELASEAASQPTRLRAQDGRTADSSLRYLVNTHWHFDHTSGNANFFNAGAMIIAHEGVLRLLARDQTMGALGDRMVEAAPEEGRPVLTFNERMNLFFNGDLVHMVHLPLAHTDGDIVVHFRDANVIHMGDLFFNGTFPFIDVDNGGNIGGIVAAIDDVLAHTNEGTLYIPGHGPLATRDDLKAYRNMLDTVHGRVKAMIDKGMTREEILSEKPTADLDATWGGTGFREPDRWVGLVYDGMVKASKRR